MGFFDDLFGGAQEEKAANANKALAAAYKPEALGYLQQGYDTGRGDVGQGIEAWSPLKGLGQKYNSATDMLLNAYGLNGPQGNAAATNAFQAGPAYQFQFDQGMEALNRRRSGSMMGNSGNADIDAIKFGQGLANQEFNPWRQGLENLGKTGVQATGAAATGESQGFTNLANLAQQYGLNQTGVSGNVLSANMDANKLEAAGKAAGAKNLLGAGTSLLSLAMGPLGGGLKGMNLGQNLFGGGSPSGYG